MPLTQTKTAKVGRARRICLLAAAVLIGILVLAYIDGGEEPIRPMVKAVTLPGAATESE